MIMVFDIINMIKKGGKIQNYALVIVKPQSNMWPPKNAGDFKFLHF